MNMETKMNNEDKENVRNSIPPKDTYFTVYYDNNGDVIGVEPPKGKEVQKLDECELFEKGLDNINKLSATLVVSKRGNSPCCIKCGRTYYCWC